MRITYCNFTSKAVKYHLLSKFNNHCRHQFRIFLLPLLGEVHHEFGFIDQ